MGVIGVILGVAVRFVWWDFEEVDVGNVFGINFVWLCR